MPVMQSPEALLIGKSLLQQIGAVFPVRLRMRGADLEIVAALSDDQLGHRTTGPYTEQRPPTELIQWVRLRAHAGALAGRFARFSIDASGQWARCLVELGGTAVRMIVVMPEEVTAESLRATHLGRWQDSVRITIMTAMEDLYRRLTRCGDGEGKEPMVDLSLAYHAVKDYAKQVAEEHPMAREFIAPTRPVLTMRWRETPANQRKKFLDALDKVERKGFPRRTVTEIAGVELILC